LRWIQQAGSGAGVAAPVIKRRKVRERFGMDLAAILGVAALLATAQSLRNRAQLPQMVKTSILRRKRRIRFSSGFDCALARWPPARIPRSRHRWHPHTLDSATR